MRLALALLTAAALHAQLPFAATYEADRTTRLQGAVTRIDWVNPRAFIFIDTPSGNWAVEIGTPAELEASGWSRGQLRAGDTVTVEGNPALGQRKALYARSVALTRTGQKFFAITRRQNTASSASAPRWPDGRVRLGAPVGQNGYWGTSSASSLSDTSAGALAMDSSGLLKNLADSARIAPFQPWAKALYEYRQRNLLRDDPAARCMPPGGPRQFHTPGGFQFIEQRELGRILVLLGGGNHNWRIIYTDGRPLAPADEVVAAYYGTSAGKWEGDTLVVDSTGYNENFWFSNGGLPHTEALRLTERFTRTSLNSLRYEVTINDPRAYTRPWVSGWTLQWTAGRDLDEFFCEENAESTFER
jgi:hypothetical protein